MNKETISKIVYILKKEHTSWNVPVLELIALQQKDPFKVLLTTILSLRTKDEVTIGSSKRLYKLLLEPKDILEVEIPQIEEAIYPCAFYKRKAIQIKNICLRLHQEFDGIVPNNIDTLLTFPGIGRKTANLIVAEGYQTPAMCVDTHVHRISNRLGFISTKTPDETEFALRKKLPSKYWNEYNTLLVAFGQHLCRPISPHCTKCPIVELCERKGVTTHR